MKTLLAIIALTAAAPAMAKDPVPPPAPSPEPDYAKVRATVEGTLKQNLFDPSSAQIVYTSGFQWGYAKPLIGKRTWGWIACGTLNAKNRFGGYVGATGFWVMSDANGTITWDNIGNTMSTCDTGQRAELQPALLNAPTTTPAAPAAVGVAAELGQLADLLKQGVITQAEFDAQKAKLLAR